MILKRKKEKPIGVGMICKIRDDIKALMQDNENYRNNSVSHRQKTLGATIYKQNLHKNADMSTIMIEDADMVYVGKDSIFGNNIVEIIPLTIDRDFYGYAIKKLLNDKKKFLIDKNSLSYPSKIALDALDGYYHDNLKQKIKSDIRNNYGYDFNW